MTTPNPWCTAGHDSAKPDCSRCDEETAIWAAAAEQTDVLFSTRTGDQELDYIEIAHLGGGGCYTEITVADHQLAGLVATTVWDHHDAPLARELAAVLLAWADSVDQALDA